LDFWDTFASIGEGFEVTLLCIGDFNSILNQYEKIGGRLVVSSSHCCEKTSKASMQLGV
jgi:hypothetical protein